MIFNSFVNNYFDTLHETMKSLDYNSIETFKTILQTLPKDSRIFILGNGGSAATASHMANDLGIGLKRRNKLSVNVSSLSDNISVCSAIANDTGYENIFYLQLKDVLQPQDIIVAISCSGNSPNIIKAVQYAKEIGSHVVALSGFDGGELHQYSDTILHVNSQKGDYGLVEDAHMIINHLLYTWFLSEDTDD